jgi:hypothetical protein
MPFQLTRLKILAMVVVTSASVPVHTRAADLEGQDAIAVPTTEGFDKNSFGGVRQNLRDWNVVIGTGAMYAPIFKGSDEFEVSPVPVFSARIGDRVSIDPTGLARCPSIEWLHAVEGGYKIGRSEDDSDHLASW